MRITTKEALARGWISSDSVKPVSTTPATSGKPSSGRAPNKRDVEGQEQAQVIKMFRARYGDLGALLIHIPNGGSRKNAFEGWRLKEQGVRAGVSDLFLPIARGGFHGLWLEFKAGAPYTAAVTPQQKQWLALMTEQGYCAHLCIGIEEAFSTLENYMALPV